MNKDTRNRMRLEQMFLLSRNRPGYQSMFACGTKESARVIATFARDMIENGESINVKTGEVKFPNGSRLVIDYPECVRGDSFHYVIMDEIVDERMAAHLKTRERLL